MQNTSDFIPKELHHAPTAEAAMKEVKDLLGILDAHLSKSAYLSGDRFTLADLDLAAVLGWGLYVIKVDLAPYPKLAAWLGAASQRPGNRAAMAAT